MNTEATPPPAQRKGLGFADDFKRFFMRGLAAIMPTLVTLWLLIWVWNFLWNSLGVYIIYCVERAWYTLGDKGFVPFQPWGYITRRLDINEPGTRILGVGLSVLLVYVTGVFVGNLIGRTFWRLAERMVLRIPIIRAIYPAVKQVTDFVLADHSRQFSGSRVVACQPHEQNIWSIGLVTGSAEWSLNETGPEEMVTVFIPSTPTAISGYVLVVPRNRVVELPMSVEEAMRLLVSGGVIVPHVAKMVGQARQASQTPAAPPLGKVG